MHPHKAPPPEVALYTALYQQHIIRYKTTPWWAIAPETVLWLCTVLPYELPVVSIVGVCCSGAILVIGIALWSNLLFTAAISCAVASLIIGWTSPVVAWLTKQYMSAAIHAFRHLI